MSRGFRVWDTETEGYLPESRGGSDGVLGVTLDGTGIIYLEDGEANIQLARRNGVIIERDTGLKDKNGKRICEGDIIRYKVLRDDCSTRHGYKYREVIEAVEYDTEFGMYITAPYSYLGTIANHYEPEVIGNIHENPELLGGGK